MSGFIKIPFYDANHLIMGGIETDLHKYIKEVHEGNNYDFVIYEKSSGHYFSAQYFLDREDHPEEEPFDFMGEFIRFDRVYPHYRTEVSYMSEPQHTEYLRYNSTTD